MFRLKGFLFVFHENFVKLYNVNSKFFAHLPERFDPVAFSLGPLEVRWYGLMYLFAFVTVYALVRFRVKHEKFLYPMDVVEDFFVWGIMGVLLGGRLGYALFYQPAYYLTHPWEIILPFQFSDGIRYVGIFGMSYHGGLIGVLLALFFFCRKRKIDVWYFADLFAPVIPLGYTFGRIGNFINGELYGRVTTAPWGMFFPMDASGRLRHPSQLYEAFFEGIFLFAVLWSLRKIKYFNGFLSLLYIFGYGLVRFFIEFTREPDWFMGFVLGPLTMGQILCLLMMLSAGIVFIRKRPDLRKTPP